MASVTPFAVVAFVFEGVGMVAVDGFDLTPVVVAPCLLERCKLIVGQARMLFDCAFVAFEFVAG